MSVRVTLNCPVKTGAFADLKPFLQANLPNVRSFNGNLMVKVLFNEETQEMLLEEEWLTQKHHQDYIAFIDANGVLATLAEFLTAPPQIKYFARLDI